jgi:uncharacterized small protein (DUF1192 family)
VTRHTPLTNKLSLHFFELPKIPERLSRDDKLLLWLSLFKAETVEELEKIKRLEVADMNEAINAYNQIKVSSEFREVERMRSLARHNEASALHHARQEERKKWQSIVAEKDTMIANKDAEIARLRAELDKKRND